VGVSGVCRKLGMSRQNYYARRQRRQRRQVDGDLVADLVRQERAVQSRVGVRKLHRLLQEPLQEAGVVLGRDRMFAELRRRDLLVGPLPRSWPQTTRYDPSLPVFRNEIKDLAVERANQVWVADLTYVRTEEGFLFLSLITDRYSRKIVGQQAGETLETRETAKALDQALRGLPQEVYPIHHSDRGCQYCSHEYVQQLQERGLGISMTEADHCAENALAERVNGILKQEYGLGASFKTKALARQAILEGIHLYNTRRLHTALDYQIPAVVHAQSMAA
jgi:putative transposase